MRYYTIHIILLPGQITVKKNNIYMVKHINSTIKYDNANKEFRDKPIAIVYMQTVKKQSYSSYNFRRI